MNRKRKLLAVLTTCAFVASCSPRVVPPVIAEKTDSVRVEVRERIVHDTITFQIEKEREVVVTRDTSSHLENTYATSDASVRDGVLRHVLETKPQEKRVAVTNVVRDTIVVQKSAETIVVEVERKLTKKQEFLIASGRVFIIAVVVLFLLMIVRLFLKLRRVV